jgi:hypothetical protein
MILQYSMLSSYVMIPRYHLTLSSQVITAFIFIIAENLSYSIARGYCCPERELNWAQFLIAEQTNLRTLHIIEIQYLYVDTETFSRITSWDYEKPQQGCKDHQAKMRKF